MGTVYYGCGCWISSSMFGAHGIMGVNVCFRHSMDDEVHEAMKALAKVADECKLPPNWQDPEVQAALVALAAAVRAICA